MKFADEIRRIAAIVSAACNRYLSQSALCASTDVIIRNQSLIADPPQHLDAAHQVQPVLHGAVSLPVAVRTRFFNGGAFVISPSLPSFIDPNHFRNCRN